MKPQPGKDRSRRVACAAAVAAALVLPAGAGRARADEEAESVRLVGDTQGVWLIARYADGACRVAAKPLNEQWGRSWPQRFYDVAGAAAVGDSAVLFFAAGGVVRCYPDRHEPQPGIRAPEGLWPGGTEVLAACAAEGPEGAVLVLVRRPARAPTTSTATTSAPATTTASAPALAQLSGAAESEELAILEYAGRHWREVATGPVRPGTAPVRAFMAARAGRVYVLLRQPRPALWVLHRGAWKRIALPAAFLAAEPLALTPLGKWLVLVGFNVPARGQVGLSRYVGGRWREVQVVRRGDAAMTWPEASPPAVGRLGEHLAFVWREVGGWRFGRCGLDGRMSAEPMNVFAPPKSTPAASMAVQVFFWGVFGVILALMFWPGQPLRTAPFALPATMLPAGLDKRALAFVVDVLPFALAAWLAGGQSDLESLWREVRENTLPDRQVYAYLGFFLTAYPAYACLMEYRFGATVGKMLMRLRVVGDRGRRATLRETVLRNVSKVPELLAPILVLFPILTRYRQRLGDKIAWTAVIDAAVSLPPEVLQPPPPGGQDEQSR